MGIFNIFSDLFGENSSSELHGTDINPANGLPMIDDSGIDVMGNAYGMDDSSGGADIEPFNFDC